MKMRKYFALLLLIIPILSYGEFMSFLPVSNAGYYDSSSFSWDANSRSYMLNAEGVLLFKSGASSDARKIQLPIKPFIVQVSILNDINDMFLVVETDFAGDGGGNICKVKSDISAIHWCRHIPSMSIKALASKDSIWIGGYGFVGQLNAISGKLNRYQNSLNRPCEISLDDSLTAYWTVETEGDEIVFHAVHAKLSNDRRLVINPSTGKIIKCGKK